MLVGSFGDKLCAEVGEAYTWGWKECVPSGKFIPVSIQKDAGGKQNSSQNEPGIPFRWKKLLAFASEGL